MENILRPHSKDTISMDEFMRRKELIAGEYVKHFKRELLENKDNLMYVYKILGVGAMTDDPDTYYVVYEALYGNRRTWIRPFEEFMSEVDHEKYPDVKQKYRFVSFNSCE